MQMRHAEEGYDKSISDPIDLAYLFRDSDDVLESWMDDVDPPIMDDLDPTQPTGPTRQPDLKLATKAKVDYRGHVAKSGRRSLPVYSFEETQEDLDESSLNDNSDDDGGDDVDDGDNMAVNTNCRDSTPPWLDEDTTVDGTNLADARDEYEALHPSSGQIYTRRGAGSRDAQEQASWASGHEHYPSIDDLSSSMGGMHVSNQWYDSIPGYDYGSSYDYGQGYRQEVDLYDNEATSWLAQEPQQSPQPQQLYSGQSSVGSTRLPERTRSGSSESTQQRWQDSSTSYGQEQIRENETPQPTRNSWWW